MRGRAVAAHVAHNHEVTGSNPVPATISALVGRRALRTCTREPDHVPSAFFTSHAPGEATLALSPCSPCRRRAGQTRPRSSSAKTGVLSLAPAGWHVKVTSKRGKPPATNDDGAPVVPPHDWSGGRTGGRDGGRRGSPATMSVRHLVGWRDAFPPSRHPARVLHVFPPLLSGPVRTGPVGLVRMAWRDFADGKKIFCGCS